MELVSYERRVELRIEGLLEMMAQIYALNLPQLSVKQNSVSVLFGDDIDFDTGVVDDEIVVFDEQDLREKVRITSVC